MDEGPIILAEQQGVVATPQEGHIVVDSYMGMER